MDVINVFLTKEIAMGWTEVAMDSQPVIGRILNLQ